MMKRNRGFTLIELMFIIAIIVILTSIIIASVMRARMDSRDAGRINDMKQVQLALEEYYEKNRRYPSGDGAGCSGWDTPGNGTFIQELKTSGFLKKDIKDPKSDSNCGNLRYNRFPANYNGCARAAFYVLQIVDLEKTTTGTHPQSPGWSCGSTNWNTGVEWVAGKYE